ncbi:MAG: phage terminase large subunit [Clostridiales bacterium]|nr:phage terminase large subunit [Candidatus Cacconaster stercorequi]
MTELRIGKPNEKQMLFLRDKHRHLAYGGARGGGKSWAVRTKAKLLALRYPGIKILIIRRTYPELQNNHIRYLREELVGIAKYNDSKKEFQFPGGSTIQMGYCNADKDVDQYQGAEYDVIFMDEAGQLQEEWIKKINACVRGVNDFPKRTYYTLNPGGPSHGYFKRLFVDRRFEKNERPEDYAFIQAKVTDNHALMQSQPDYVEGLKILPERLRKMWLDGDWDVYAGQFFEEFRNDPDHYQDRRFTHVVDPFEIPDGWRIYRSYDFGYAKPFSCAWWAVDYDGVIYRILELYGCTGEPNEGVCWTPDKQFREIAKIEDTHPWLKGKEIHGVADPSIWDKSRGDSIYDTAMKYRVYFTPGDNERIPGWMQVHYRMAFDAEGYPMMYVFSTCKAFIRTMPLLMYDEHRLEDLDTSMEDHVADEVRYFCMSRPIKPRMDIPKPVMLADPLNQAGQIGKYNDARRILTHG